MEEETNFRGADQFLADHRGKIDRYVALDGGYKNFTYGGTGIYWHRYHILGPGGHTRSDTPPYSATLPLARAIQRIYAIAARAVRRGLADRYRRERGFMLGVAVFVAASAACAAATSLPMLVAFRVLQAAGAALLTPTSLGPDPGHVPRPSAATAPSATWTAVGGLAAALGPAVGGLLVAASWRWVFLVNVPIGLAALVVGWRLLPEVPGHPIPRPDALSALLITAGVGALTLGLVEGGDWGWGSTRTIAVLAAAVVLLALFAARTARHHNPLIDARAVPGAAVHRRLGGRARCSRSRSARCSCRGCCGRRTCGTGRR